MVWRRSLVRSDSTIAGLHYTIQTAMDWSDVHLNRFHIHGQDFGIYHDGGMSFADNPEKMVLSTFGFRTRELFIYEYDFDDENDPEYERSEEDVLRRFGIKTSTP